MTAKSKPNSSSTDSHGLSEDQDSHLRLSSKVRGILSFVIGFHLLALIAQPMSMFSEMRAADTGLLRDVMAPYIEVFYLDHGYFFFAPNPGPNHLVECQIEPAEGSGKIAPKELWFRFPDRNLHWPRLYYHRQFMRSEFYNTVFVPSNAVERMKDNPVALRQVQRDWDIFQSVEGSFVKHLKAIHPGSRVQLQRIEHQLPTSFQVLQEGWRLTDPRLYVALPNLLDPLPKEDPASTSTDAGKTEGSSVLGPAAAPPANGVLRNEGSDEILLVPPTKIEGNK